MKILKNKKGITLISLALTIVVMVIITITITVSLTSTKELKKYYAVKDDIVNLTELVQKYYLDNNDLPKNGNSAITYSSFATSDTDQKDRNPNDNDNYYEINTSKLNIKLENDSNTYLVNEQSLTVYCKQGFVISGKTHYTASNDFEGGTFASYYYSNVDLPIISVVTLKSNDSIDEYHVTKGDTVTLKVLSNYTYTTNPTITVTLGSGTNLETFTTSSENSKIITFECKINNNHNDGDLVSFSISGYQANGKTGDTISETTFGEKIGYIYKLPYNSYTIPYLPGNDYKQVNGTDLTTGLVIEDKSGNQYVWVEVPTSIYIDTTYANSTSNTNGANSTGTNPTYTVTSSTDYTGIENILKAYTSAYRNDTSYTDTYYSDAQTGLTSTEYSDTKKAMLKSVYQNGGFWVGRYEAGDSTSTTSNTARTSSTGYTDTAVIKADQHPYDFITCSQAESLAKNFAPNGYNSSLLFGVQWDLMLKFIESKKIYTKDGTNTLIDSSILKTNSQKIGNYKNSDNFDIIKGMYNAANTSNWTLTTWQPVISSYTKTTNSYILLTTGATDRNSTLNIYDIAGNVSEWTMEYTSISSYPCDFRGGGYNGSGIESPASIRYNRDTTNNVSGIGFRVALY